jgi:hypothetical protein
VPDEWCLIAELDGDESQVATVVTRLSEALSLERGQLTRDGRVVRVYSDSERLAAQAEQSLLDLLHETELGYEVWQERWDEKSGAWEELAPDLDEEVGEEGDPAEDDPAEGEEGSEPGLDVRVISWQEAKLEVEISCASEEEVAALAGRLAALGIETSTNGRSLRIPAADTTDAGTISDWLWAVATPGADIEVREASFWDKLRP